MAEQSKQLTLSEAVGEYQKFLSDDEKAFAILYTPQKCLLVLIDKTGKFYNHDGEFLPEHMFEARIFNGKAELRWLNEESGKGKTVIISDSIFPNTVGQIPQTYLLWGENIEASQNGWTKFAEARIGSFFVPVDKITRENQRAQFTAIEYLCEYVDGNVAVAEERLTGIVPVPIKQEAQKSND